MPEKSKQLDGDKLLVGDYIRSFSPACVAMSANIKHNVEKIELSLKEELGAIQLQ